MAGKKQHFVPQFLLRNFSLLDAPGKIAAYRFTEEKFLPRTSIRDQAHENNFYGNPQVEDALAGIEGAASRVIEAAILAETLPAYSSSDHHVLLTFVLVQAFRTRAAAEETDAMTNLLAHRIMRDVPELKGHLESVEVSRENAPHFTLGTAALCLDLAADLRYKLVCNRTGVPFITSDHPAVMYNQFLEPRKKNGCNTGIAVKGLQVFLPLGPRHLLLLFDAEVYTVGGRRLTSQRVELTTEADAHALNLLQGANAAGTLFFNDEMPLSQVTRLVKKAAKYRSKKKAELLEYQPTSGDTESDGVLLRIFHPDTRTHLRLKFVRLTPQAEQYDFGGRVIHRRNPALCKLHSQFTAAVRTGRYRVGQFAQYLDDLDSEKSAAKQSH